MGLRQNSVFIANFPTTFAATFIAILVGFFAFPELSSAESRRRSGDPASSVSEATLRKRLNAWSIGLAGGLLEGAPIHLATEIARVANETGEINVRAIVTRGLTENVNNLLYANGVDAAIINRDALEEYQAEMPRIQLRIVYIVNLFPSQLHIFVRPEIRSLADLAGKKVNFNTQGSAAAYSGPLILSRLGLHVEKMFIPHPVALEQMRRGEIAAVVFVTSKPVDAFVKGNWDEGYKFLSVAYGPRFEDYYLPSSLDPADYPNLIKKDERIATIAVPTILAAPKLPPGSPRYHRIARFVDELFGRIDKLRSPGFDPKWKDFNLSEPAPGLERFRAAQDWLDRRNPKQSARP
jgi:hypothetical protein